jgi:hypothetical protein
LENNSRKPRVVTKDRHSDSRTKKRVNLIFSGDDEEGRCHYFIADDNDDDDELRTKYHETK